MDKLTESQKITITWSEIDEMCQMIAEQLKKLSFSPDLIVTPLRGGVIPAVIVAHLLNVRDLITVSAKRTSDDSINADKKELILDKLPNKEEVEDKNILLIDEIMGTGETLTKLKSYLFSLSPKKIIVATLFTSPYEETPNSIKPDISFRKTDKWVVFPWEIKD